MDSGARHRPGQSHRPARAAQGRDRHQCPRHPWRSRIRSGDCRHAGAGAWPAARCSLAGAAPMASLPGAAPQWQDRRHIRRRPDRRGPGAESKAFGMQVVGVTSAPRKIPGFDRMHDREELAKVVGDFDFFVLLTPLTAATRNSIDAAIFAAMTPTSYLINLARGGVVDEPALVAALAEQRIAGAALDVFR